MNKVELITIEDMLRAKMDLRFRKKFILKNDSIIWKIISQRVPNAKKDGKNVLFQEGVIGFIQAIMSFEPEKVNTKPHNHIYTCIRNRFRKVFIKSIKNGLKFSYKMLYYVNRHNGKRIEFKTKDGKWVGFSEVKSLKDLEPLTKENQWSPKKDFDSTEKPIPCSSGSQKEMTIGDTLQAEGKSPLEELEASEALEMFSKYLEDKGSERQKKIIELKFGDDPKTLRQIGDEVGCSHETVNREINNVMSKFKNHYKRIGEVA